MKSSAKYETIDIDALRVGMFVRLDLGWMSHPFPLSSFRIANEQQLATLRGLGLKQVRWVPAQSDPAVLEAPKAAAPADTVPAAALPAAADVLVVTPDAAPAANDPHGQEDAGAARLAKFITASTPGPSSVPEQAARAAHRLALAQQRDALQRCEQQFAEVTASFRDIVDVVHANPKQAAAGAQQMSRALVDKMLGEHDMCIRLLTEAAGDKASSHALNVTVVSMLMARSFGLPEADLLDLGVGAMLHDMGKLDLPERVRHRDENFTSAEMAYYEEHVAHGVAQARKMGLSPGATLIIAQHHEHADGSGFPLHLNTDRMCPGARILALVNRYDNLCNPHLLARALTPHEALSQLFAQSKTKFDTAILGAFIRMMGVYPAGSTVQLTDDRYAMVVSVNSSRPLRPRVLVHEPSIPREEALVLDLEAVQGLGIRRSLRPSQLPLEAVSYLSPRARVAYFFEPVTWVGEAEARSVRGAA